MRGRGLKLYIDTPARFIGVAPHAGAWIETLIGRRSTRLPLVAPHAGAWIETGN